MKKLIQFLFVVFVAITVNAQDVIVKKDGSTVLCKIIQVTGNEVIYLKWSDLKGPQYIMDGSLVSNINYQDGRQDKLNEQTSNNYAPGIQQTGDSEYNDNALLALDRARKNVNSPYLKKAKTLRIIGWTVGSVLLVGGVALIWHGYNIRDDVDETGIIVGGSVLVGGGIATTTGCLIKAHQLKKKYYSLSCIPFLQRDINTGNGTTLSAGVDIILDNQTHNFLPGLGLQFNF